MIARHSRAHRAGFALLLVLVLLSLLATATAGVARRSLADAVRADEHVRHLQRKWAVASAERLLPRAEAMITSKQEALTSRQPPHFSRRVPLRLGDYEALLIVGDEQAKANLNMMLAHTDQTTALGRLTETARSLGYDGAAHLPHPSPENSLRDSESLTQATAPISIPAGHQAARETSKTEPEESDNFEIDPLILTWEQVFPGMSPQSLLSGQHGQPPLIEAVTVWGDGRLRMNRASDQAIRLALAPPLGPGQLQQLAEMIVETPDITVSDALKRLGSTEREREAIQPRLCDQSRCYSIWVVLKDKRRSWHYLTVSEGSEQATHRLRRFDWQN